MDEQTDGHSILLWTVTAGMWVARDFGNFTVWLFICSLVWMVRRNARVVLEVFGRDEKNKRLGESLSLEKKVPRISVDAGCGR
jgi:hypothetical protein